MNDAERRLATRPTAILDWRHPAIVTFVDDVGVSPGGDERALLQRAHGRISVQVRPVYSLDEEQPVSRTLQRGRGSCSQRMAILEAVARARDIPTRVHGLRVDGRFWYPRFGRMAFLVPRSVILAWPDFFLDGGWVNVSELFSSFAELGQRSPLPFTNEGGETLFEAISRTAVDWTGETREGAGTPACDLSSSVGEDLGVFVSRDALFAAHGQTVGRLARFVAEPILGRRGPGRTGVIQPVSTS